MSLLRSQSSMSRTRRYFYLFLKECFLTIGANWACACSYSALSLIGTSIADSCALQVWKEGRFSLLISDHKIFWSFELNDLWSKKICRSKMIVWSGATFILRWSCLLDLLDNWMNNFVFFCALFLHFPLQKKSIPQVHWPQIIIFSSRYITVRIRFLPMENVCDRVHIIQGRSKNPFFR